MAAKPPAVIPFCSSPPAKSLKYSGNIAPVLETRANPESHPGHYPLAVVDAVLDNDPHADHEQHRQQDCDVGGRDRPRNGQQHRRAPWAVAPSP